MLPFSFESENRTVREILSMGGRELLGLVDIIEQLVQKVRQKEDCAARKLGVSFWQYLTDRISHTYAIPPLPGLIQQRAASNH
jgi:hypothetical protein